MSNARVIARNSIWTFLDTIVGILSTLVASIAVARVMGPDKLGYYNYALWIANMTGLVAAFGVPVATRKFAAEYVGRGDFAVARAIIRATFRFQAVVAAVVISVGLAIVFTFVAPERRLYSALAVLSLCPHLMYAVPAAAIVATEDVSWNVRASVVGTLINVVGVVLTLVLGWDLPGLTASLLTARVVDFVLRFGFYKKVWARLPGGETTLPDDVRKRMVQFCWLSSLLLALDVLVWDRSEILFLERWASMRDVAFYSLSFNIVANLLVLPRVLAWSADTTILVQQGRAPETVGRIAVTTMRFMAIFAIPAGFGLAALASPLLRTLYGSKYVDAIPVLTVLALFSLGKALLLPAQHLLVATEHQGILLRWGAVLALLNVGANLWLVPRHGALGAAFAKGSVQVIATTGLWAFVRHRFKVGIPTVMLSKLLAISAIMFAAVSALGWYLPALATIALGVPLGLLIVMTLLRAFRCLEPADHERLLSLQRMFPSRLRAPFGAIVRFVVA